MGASAASGLCCCLDRTITVGGARSSRCRPAQPDIPLSADTSAAAREGDNEERRRREPVQCGLHRHPLLHLRLAQLIEGKPTRSAGPPTARAPEAARQQGPPAGRECPRGAAHRPRTRILLVRRPEGGACGRGNPDVRCHCALPCCRDLGPVRWPSAERRPGSRRRQTHLRRRLVPAWRRSAPACAAPRPEWRRAPVNRRRAGATGAVRHARASDATPANTRPRGGTRNSGKWLPPGPQPSGTTCNAATITG